MNKSVVAAISIAAFVLPGLALAQSTPRIDKRQENQDKRIERGVESGQLTKKEAARLEKGQNHVERLEDKATADGKVTKREKARIEHAQDKQSKRIHKQRHDKQKVNAD
jgi:hypothetical protein